MVTGPILLTILVAASVALRSATKGNAIPASVLAVLASVFAVFFMHESDAQREVLIAWGLCAVAIVTAYVGRQVEKVRG